MRIAAHDDACLCFRCPDLDAAYAYFHARGIAPKEPKIAPYDIKQLYLRDPDGYDLCLPWPAKRDLECAPASFRI